MSDLPLEVKDDFRKYLGDELGGPVIVYRGELSADIQTKIEDTNPLQELTPESPAGVGRVVQLLAGRLKTGELLLRQAQSVFGVKGSTILTLDSATPVSDQGGGVGAYITIDNDFKVRDGVAGQGVIQDLDIDVGASIEMSVDHIHGLYAPDRTIIVPPPDGANLHTMRNVAVYNAKTDGIHFAAGNDKLVCDRLRSEGSGGIGIYLAGGDIKARAMGSSAVGPALRIDGAAIELDQFDLWRPNGASSDPTLDIIGGTNGCVVKSGTIEGKTRFLGKNTSGDNDHSPRFINCRAQFAFVHFKHDKKQDCDCYLEAQSADLVELISCKFGRSGPDKAGEDDFTPYPYLIKISNEGLDTDPDNLGLVKISGGTGMLRYLGRFGDVIKMRMDCTKHFCNFPRLVLFDWGRPGTIEVVPVWAVDSPDPKIRTHVRMDGLSRSRDEFPFGFLAWGIGRGLVGGGPDRTLDDDDGLGNNWKPPLLPNVSSDYCYAMRVIP